MPETTPAQVVPKRRWWLFLTLLFILGLATHLLLPQIATFEKSLAVLKSMTWWLVVSAALAQLLSYLGSGYMLQAIVANRDKNFSIWQGVLITLASYSVGLVAGGWIGGAAATYGWMKLDKANSESASLASILPALLNDAALMLVSILGVTYLFIVHDLTKMQLVGYGVVLVFLGALLLMTVMAAKRPKAVKFIATKFGAGWAKLHHKDYDSEKTNASVDRLIAAWRSLNQGSWLKPALGALANIGFDMLTLYLVFLAAGYKVNLSVLLAGYSLPLMLGKIAFILPGGLGVIEGSMTALFESLKGPADIVVVSILGYRLLSFWLPTLFGFLAAAYMGRKGSHQFGL